MRTENEIDKRVKFGLARIGKDSRGDILEKDIIAVLGFNPDMKYTRICYLVDGELVIRYRPLEQGDLIGTGNR